ncbi:hypothetical protein [Chryseobacterium limigenitum]|nr:hypothetical protein [Chryseobacterium limigenitum]
MEVILKEYDGIPFGKPYRNFWAETFPDKLCSMRGQMMNAF